MGYWYLFNIYYYFYFYKENTLQFTLGFVKLSLSRSLDLAEIIF